MRRLSASPVPPALTHLDPFFERGGSKHSGSYDVERPDDKQIQDKIFERHSASELIFELSGMLKL